MGLWEMLESWDRPQCWRRASVGVRPHNLMLAGQGSPDLYGGQLVSELLRGGLICSACSSRLLHSGEALLLLDCCCWTCKTAAMPPWLWHGGAFPQISPLATRYTHLQALAATGRLTGLAWHQIMLPGAWKLLPSLHTQAQPSHAR